jgi:hypothetical protein
MTATMSSSANHQLSMDISKSCNLQPVRGHCRPFCKQKACRRRRERVLTTSGMQTAINLTSWDSSGFEGLKVGDVRSGDLGGPKVFLKNCVSDP